MNAKSHYCVNRRLNCMSAKCQKVYYIRTYIYMYMYMYIHIHVPVHVRTCIYIYMIMWDVRTCTWAFIK